MAVASSSRPVPGPRLYPTAGLHGRLVHELGQQIVQGRFRAGDTLPPVPELLRRYAVSRTSIREVMRVLAAKGLVELRQRAGARVRPMDGWNLLDPDVLNWLDLSAPDGLLAELLEIRTAIEPAAARLAAAHAGPREVDRIETCARLMLARVGDPDLTPFYEADIAFHEAVLDAAHNRFLRQLGGALLPALQRSFAVHRAFDRIPAFRANLREVTCPQHDAVARAIARRRPDEAAAAMTRILENTRNVQERFGRGVEPA